MNEREAINRIYAQGPHPLAPRWVIGLFEREAAAQHLADAMVTGSVYALHAAGDPPNGLDAVYPRYMPRQLREAMAQQGMNADWYCDQLRAALRATEGG